MQAQEKSLIRSRLFQGTVEEEDRKLGLHNALLCAKVVRVDYPNEWPEALPEIIGLLRTLGNGDQRKLEGTLQILLRVTKELGSARLRRKQTALQSVTPEIVFVLAGIYSEKSAAWVSYMSNQVGDGAEVEMAMLNSLSALKVLRRLVIFGYEQPHLDKTVEEFWTLSQTHFGKLLEFVSHDSQIPPGYQEVIGRHLLQFTKMHIDMAGSHPGSFPFLPNSLALVRSYWDLVAKFAEVFDKSEGIRQGSSAPGQAKSKVEGPLLERLALKGLLLLRACVRIAFQPQLTFKYRSPELKAEQEQAKDAIKNELFKEDLVLQIVNAIISHLFVFRKSDLEAWDEDPEEWEQQEQSEGSAFEWEVRPCAEKLFLDLLTNFKELLIPPLLEYFRTAQAPDADIATKEAVYTAMGLAAAHVGGIWDFDSILATTIVNDAQASGGIHKVLRRRIAILISKWAPVKLEDSSRPLAYQIFRHFLNPADENNDLVVRITAAREMRWIADEPEFSVEAFLPYTSDILAQLIDLLQIVEVDEIKLAILETVRILVTRMEEQVSQFGDQLMSALPTVWEKSGAEDYMVKQAIIAILSALVMSMGSESQRYQHFMVPLIAEAARPGSDLHVHLVDESLELWNAILTQSKPPLAPDIIDLALLAPPLVEYQSETASETLVALESYVLLAPGAMLEDRLRRPTLQALSLMLDSRAQEHVRTATYSIEYLIRGAVELGGRDGVSLILSDMVESGFMRKIMTNLHNAWEAKQTTGPNRKVPKLNTVTEGHYFAILARLALSEPSLFVEMLAGFGELSQIWAWLSSSWFSYTLDMDDVARQKLYLLALSRLLELPSPMQELALAKLQDYFSMWTSVIMEIQGGVVHGADSLIWAEVGPQDYDTQKSIKEREVVTKDPVHSVHALAFVKMRLEDVVARVGGEGPFAEIWTVNVDQDVLQKFQQMMRAVG